ncbi:MAG: alpha/beta hydrolase [Spirochaetes bacterium]|nr:alpha/beta hydrolase [Spirochaetota bacterium]
MAPVAEELCRGHGVLEPLQTKSTIDSQVLELLGVLRLKAELPVTLIGHSWGAWLAFIFASRYPEMMNKCILVGAGPFEERYVPVMNETRRKRLTAGERREAETLTLALESPGAKNRKEILKKLGDLIARADSYDPISIDKETTDLRPGIFLPVMKEALELRKSGALLDMGKNITCPVIAIHGDHDPHPYRGVIDPLSRNIRLFKPILLTRCGHYPWKERHGRDEFFSILNSELRFA